MVRVAILGSTGMLGSTLTRVLEQEFGTVTEFNRAGTSITGNNNVVTLDVLNKFDLHKSFEGLRIDYIINAIGMIKQRIDEKKPEDIEAAKVINSKFAIRLNEFSMEAGTKVIQIGTDCVFSGIEGNYSEGDKFNPTDVYSETKNSGERASTESMIIRCSVIGKEPAAFVSLLGWVLSQPKGGSINGFTNHLWNGLTTLHFAKVVSGIIKADNFSKGIVHLVPKDKVSKYELIKIIANEFGRSDLDIREFSAENAIDRSLVTLNSVRNLQMWQAGGYNKPPTIQEMVSQYANWTQGKLLG
jgi:dTDP-4-dehydrorhamnose reductase